MSSLVSLKSGVQPSTFEWLYKKFTHSITKLDLNKFGPYTQSNLSTVSFISQNSILHMIKCFEVVQLISSTSIFEWSLAICDLVINNGVLDLHLLFIRRFLQYHTPAIRSIATAIWMYKESIPHQCGLDAAWTACNPKCLTIRETMKETTP